MTVSLASRSAIPNPGGLVVARGRHWLVTEVRHSNLPLDPRSRDGTEGETIVSLSSVEDDGIGEEISVLWEVEPGRRILEAGTLPDPSRRRFDDPAAIGAFLDALRWGAVTNAESLVLQAPFRAGIAIEDYQLEPLIRSLRLPRVNLLIADDVGLGKTVEAGLVVQELLLRHRARRIMVVCPAPLTTKWRDEMATRFGLDFQIVDTDELRQVRQERGLHANPFRVHLRTIVSLSWLRGGRCQRLIEELLAEGEGLSHRHPLDLLIVDEAHHCAPPGRGRYAIDSQQTRAVHRIADRAEHRMFLSATPHNGYEESWTALLAMLDPQRFARGVAPNASALQQVLIRRLKSELTDPGGAPRYPARVVEEITVTYPKRELEGHRLLRDYTAARHQRLAKRDDKAARSADLITLLLKKRLFSSPFAFARTLRLHARAITEASEDRDLSGSWTETQRRDLLFGDWADDESFEAAEEAAAGTATRSAGPPGTGERELLTSLLHWADEHAERSDAKAQALIAYLRGVCRGGDPDGAWNDERVAIFTEYRDTQNWLQRLLEAHGLAEGGRLALLHGGMDEEERERTKDDFQKPPDRHPVRILLATDTASEGIDLQLHCHRLVNYDIPFNPNRLEQRAGRIDRYGQHHPPEIRHFVGSHWRTAGAESHDADLEFLTRVALKVATMREDLGSVNPVLARAVEARMLGEDLAGFDPEKVVPVAAAREALKVERALRQDAKRLRDSLSESQRALHCSPADIERVVRVGLDLGRQPSLQAETDGVSGAEVWSVPQLTGSWTRTTSALEDRDYGRRRISFDPEVAASRQDLVLAHLNHPLVAMATRLLRAEVWSGQHLARVAALTIPDGRLTDAVLAAYCRLVIVGADGNRLHEELFTAGGSLRGTSFTRLGVQELDSLLDAALGPDATPSAAPPSMRDELARIWPQLMPRLTAAIDARAKEREGSLGRALERRRSEDEARTNRLLDDFAASLSAAVARLGAIRQLTFADVRADEAPDERAQLEQDAAAWRERLDRIPEEREREMAAIARRYETTPALVFTAAVVHLSRGGSSR
jgi:superfamily II DNA or RNA helicase